MNSITEDKWDQKVWGAATAEGTNERDTANSNLTLYWGQKVTPEMSLPNVIYDTDESTGSMGS